MEVVVVDDGSTDATASALRRWRADDRVRVVVHPANRGYGAPCARGSRRRGCRGFLLTDGDRQFDLAELVGLLPLAAGHDLVAGYRIDRQDGLARRAAGRAWSWLTRRTFGFGVMDVDCAFKLVRTRSVRRLALTSDGAMVSASCSSAACATGGTSPRWASTTGRGPPERRPAGT